MRRALVVIAVTLTTLSWAAGDASAFGSRGAADHRAGTGASIDPAVQQQLANAASDDLLDVVVVLRTRADLSTVTEKKRWKRLAAVEHTLRTVAATSQADLLAFLSAKQQEGLVARFDPLWIFNGIRVKATPGVIRELAARPDVHAIRPNLTIQAPEATATTTWAPPEPNLDVVHAPALWALGYRGQGIVVANMDTGVDVTHPDLMSRWRGGTDSWFDPNGQHPTTPTDVSGHGTWTMGAMVGGDAGGTSIGVAPGAEWIAVKIFNDRGTATSTGIHLGFQWLLDPDGNPATPDAPNVVNNSWTSTFGCNLDFQLDLQSLRAAGILPVFAAGNDGPSAGTSESPANNPEAFAVGSTNDADVIDPSSSRGPSACAQPVYPQLVAPGVGVRTTDLYGGYASETGTSMAAPHVAGALALLLGAFPGLSADRQAAALESGAVDLGTAGADNTYGYGRLDVLAAYNWLLTTPDFTVAAAPASASTSPGGSTSFTVSIGSLNGFTGDVALSLSGLAGPQGVASFSPAVVTGGSGTSLLTVTTSSSIAPGTYPLSVTGTSGSVSHTTAVSIIVTAPADFGLSVTPASRSVVAGSATTYTVAVASLNGFAGDVGLSLTGLSTAVGGGTFSPSVVAGGTGSAQLTVATLATAAPGTYPLTVAGTSGSMSHAVAISLVVTAPADFGLSVAPSSITITRGKAGSYTVTISSLRGFAGSVGLSVSGLPSGASATFKPSSVSAPGSSTMTIKTTSKATRGTFTLTVRGSSGSLAHQATTKLVIK